MMGKQDEDIGNFDNIINVNRKRKDNEGAVQFYEECKTLYKSTINLTKCIKHSLIQAKKDRNMNENFLTNIQSMADITLSMKKISSFEINGGIQDLENIRINLWKARINVEKLALLRLTNDLVCELLDSSLTESALRLACFYNEILKLNLSGTDHGGTNVFCNTCPMLLYPLRKFSITRILQTIAGKRAEKCSYSLISGLLNNYFKDETGEMDEGEDLEVVTEQETHGFEEEDKSDDGKNVQSVANNLSVARNSISSNSNTSVEIYRALTKHLKNGLKENDSDLHQSLEHLWRGEEKHARGLLILSARVAPQLLGRQQITSAKNSGNPRPKTSIRNKLTNYYQEVLWGEVGGHLDHILFWWSSGPLGGFPPSAAQSLRDFLLQIKSTDFVSPLLMPSVLSLADAICCHLTSTSWDQLFQKTIVSAKTINKSIYQAFDIEGSVTGQLFTELLADLIKLNNTCEDLHLSIEELPLVEQIPILHRLDHSVHMIRIWMFNKCQSMAAKWDLEGFYCTCHSDITKCLQTLNGLQLIDHLDIPSTASVQVTVCTKMRQKLVSEIRENIDKLKKTTTQCINILAKDCRTECLAILHMCFPPRAYWRQNGPLPETASDYVEKYLNTILRPVFFATRKMTPEIQQFSSSMILRILCESWLEYVYLHRIKFSEHGAVQLLMDFGAIPIWLMENAQIPKTILSCLVSHEVLRRCEGVGRLLLRKWGESIKMTILSESKPPGDDFSADCMPAEMYVPNQEQWLSLRAPLKGNMCCRV